LGGGGFFGFTINPRTAGVGWAEEGGGKASEKDQSGGDRVGPSLQEVKGFPQIRTSCVSPVSQQCVWGTAGQKQPKCSPEWKESTRAWWTVSTPGVLSKNQVSPKQLEPLARAPWCHTPVISAAWEADAGGS
jgi:hypothetical protein